MQLQGHYLVPQVIFIHCVVCNLFMEGMFVPHQIGLNLLYSILNIIVKHIIYILLSSLKVSFLFYFIKSEEKE